MGINVKAYILRSIKVLCILWMVNITIYVDIIDTSAAVNTMYVPSASDVASIVLTGEEQWNDTALPDVFLDNEVSSLHHVDEGVTQVLPLSVGEVHNPAEEADRKVLDAGIEQAMDISADTEASPCNAFADSALEAQSTLNGIYQQADERIVYLTFDDGPTPSITSAILDILAEEEVRATFFVIGQSAQRYPEIITRQYEEGHGIANHTFSHVFKHIYSGLDHYIDELLMTEEVLRGILGEDKEFRLTRFPGGSFGSQRLPYRQAVNEAGYVYIDWNALNGDAETRKILPADRLVKRFKSTVRGQDSLVVLMHDAPNKRTTVAALREIIGYLKSLEYRFEILPWSR